MKFTIDELKDARGYEDCLGGLRVYPMGARVVRGGDLPNTSATEEYCRKSGDILHVGPALIAAIRERGGEVVGEVPTVAVNGSAEKRLADIIEAMKEVGMGDGRDPVCFVYEQSQAFRKIQRMKSVAPDTECADTSLLNDRVFVRQAAIACYGCDVSVSARQALDHAVELLSAIKAHEQKGTR